MPPLPRCYRPATIPISRPTKIRPRWIWRPTSRRAPAEAEPARADDCQLTPSTILEAMLFVGVPGNVPLTSQQVARLMRGVRPTEIDGMVRQLNATYAARNCPYEIAAEGPGYRMRLRDDYARLRDRFYGKSRQARLSQAAIEVLAIVAYNESLTAQEISARRGTPCGPILSQLVRRQLLCLDSCRPREAAARVAIARPIDFWNCSRWKVSTICRAAPTPIAGKRDVHLARLTVQIARPSVLHNSFAQQCLPIQAAGRRRRCMSRLLK